MQSYRKAAKKYSLSLGYKGRLWSIWSAEKVYSLQLTLGAFFKGVIHSKSQCLYKLTSG